MRNKKFSFPVNTLCGSNFSNFKKVTAGHHIDRKSMYYLTGLTTLFFGTVGFPGKKRTLRKIGQIRITQPPIFIIGFWRSGTTLLHNLLCSHPEATYVSTFQGIFPEYSPAGEWWLKPMVTPMLPRKRPADGVKLDFDLPQEEEIALGNLQPLSFYHFMYFPADIDRLISRALLLEGVTRDELEEWKKACLYLIKTSMLRTGGSVFISKNPPNAFRIPLLLEMFPEARFINIFRDREETLNSFMRFLTEVIAGIGMQKYDPTAFRESLEKLYDVYFEVYHKNKGLIPPENLIEMDYQELLKDKKGVAEMIIDRFIPSRKEEAMMRVRSFLGDMDSFYKGSKK
jgi:hypothetical protein